MNKNDLIAKVALETGLPKSEAVKAVEAVFNTIVDAMKSTEDVKLSGFGTFTVTTRAASQGRNPRTGEQISIPSSRQPKFRASGDLKKAVNP